MSTWIDDYLQHNADLTRLPIAARSAHATHFELSRNVRRAVITGAPQYFRGPQGWRAYELGLQVDASGRWGAPGAAARLGPDGVVRFGSGYAQRTLSVGWLQGERYTRLAALGSAGRAQGASLRRAAGGFEHALVLTEIGVKEELRIEEAPRLSAGEYLVYETLSEGPTTGLDFPPGSAIDADGRRFPLQRFVQGDVTYTGLPLADLEQARFPLVYDPTVVLNGLTADASIVGQASSYSTARSTSTSVDSSHIDLFVGQAVETAIPRYYVHRGFLKFSLASIEAGSEILAATLDLTCSIDVSVLADFNVQIVKYSWAAQDPLGNGNRQAAFSGCLSGALDVVWRHTAGLTTGVRLASPPLDVAWLTPGSAAYYGLRSSRDQAGQAPPSNGAEYVRIASANHSTLAYRPVLTVDYFAIKVAAGRLAAPLPHVGLYDTRVKLRARKRKTLLSAEKARG